MKKNAFFSYILHRLIIIINSFPNPQVLIPFIMGLDEFDEFSKSKSTTVHVYCILVARSFKNVKYEVLFRENIILITIDIFIMKDKATAAELR